MGRGPEQTLLPRGHTNGLQTYEKMLNIASYQGNENQTTMRYHLKPVRIAIINRTRITNVGEDAEKKEPSYIDGGTANWYSHYGKQYGGSSKN